MADVAHKDLPVVPLALDDLVLIADTSAAGSSKNVTRVASLTTAQTAAGGTAVPALTSGGELLDAAGAAVATLTSTAATLPGQVRLPSGTVTAPSVAASANTGSGIYFPFGVDIGMARNGAQFFSYGGVTSVFASAIGMVSTIGAASGVYLVRDADNTLAQRNGTAAQTFRLERTYTSDSVRAYTEAKQDATAGYILNSVNIGGASAPTNLLDVRGNGTSLFCVAANGAVIQRPPASITPAANGDLVVEATSNTLLTLKLRGTDGVVRSGTLILT